MSTTSATVAGSERPVPGPGNELRILVTGLSCPNCGGALAVEPGRHTLRCPFCDTPLLVVGEFGLRRLAVQPKIVREQAVTETLGWLAKGWNKEPRLRRETRVAEAFLCFLPFFRVEADAIGYAFGTEKRTTGSGEDQRTEIVLVERRIERHLDRTFPAVQVAEWGVGRVDLRGDQLVPFDLDHLERQGMVFSPTVSQAEVCDDALASFKTASDPAAGLHQVHFRYLATLRESLTVIYYPLWLVRYRYRKRSYQAVIDAEDGRLAYGKAPGNDIYRAVMGVVALAAACFIFTTALQWSKGDDGIVGLIAGIVALPILGWGWQHFRHGGVIEEGSGKVGK